MSRKIRIEDVAASASWHFGIELDCNGRPTQRAMEARRCAFAVCRGEGFTWSEIGRAFNRDHTAVYVALNNGHQPDPDDVAAVLANARARALADVP